MIRSVALAAAALAAWAAASAALAADDPTPDVRCMVVAVAMVSNENPQVKSAGNLASLYFLGRLDGRSPPFDLEAGLKTEMTRMTPQEIQTEAVRCGQQLQARGKAVTEIGQRIQAELAPKTP